MRCCLEKNLPLFLTLHRVIFPCFSKVFSRSVCVQWRSRPPINNSFDGMFVGIFLLLIINYLNRGHTEIFMSSSSSVITFVRSKMANKKIIANSIAIRYISYFNRAETFDFFSLSLSFSLFMILILVFNIFLSSDTCTWLSLMKNINVRLKSHRLIFLLFVFIFNIKINI